MRIGFEAELRVMRVVAQAGTTRVHVLEACRSNCMFSLLIVRVAARPLDLVPSPGPRPPPPVPGMRAPRAPCGRRGGSRGGGGRRETRIDSQRSVCKARRPKCVGIARG